MAPDPINEIFAVAGCPVIHSKSPLLFRSLSSSPYIRIAASSAGEALTLARTLGVRGMNVTAPFKESIFRFIDRHEPPAGILQSVNTVLFTGEGAVGYNTDVDGVEGMVKASGLNPVGCRCLIAGTGGAALAAAYAMSRAGADVYIWGRDEKKSSSLAEKLSVSALPADGLREAAAGFRVIINCLPPGVNVFEETLLPPDCLVIDANYHNPELKEYFLAKAVRYIGGEEWLIFQAIPAFRLFTGKDAASDMLRKAAYTEAPGNYNIITLTGFMGAGKTTAGRILASELECDFIDLDERIESEFGLTVAQIFEKHGESVFRQAEKELVLRIYPEIASSGRKTVIALGGGAAANSAIRATVQAHSFAVWLHASFDTCLARAEAGTRPLLSGDKSAEELSGLYYGRTDAYARLSGLVVNAEQELKTLAGKIISELNSL